MNRLRVWSILECKSGASLKPNCVSVETKPFFYTGWVYDPSLFFFYPSSSLSGGTIGKKKSNYIRRLSSKRKPIINNHRLFFF